MFLPPYSPSLPWRMTGVLCCGWSLTDWRAGPEAEWAAGLSVPHDSFQEACQEFYLVPQKIIANPSKIVKINEY